MTDLNILASGAAAKRCLSLFVCLLAVASGAMAADKPDINKKSGQALSSMAREMLAVHNQIRASVNLPPLQWSSRLAATAQKWANTLAATNKSAHNPRTPYGENIFITGGRVSPSYVVKEWAAEAKDYSYRTNSCRSDCGHYTQIVWKQTRSLGCGVARSKRREVWVCSYDPPGNYTHEWPY